MRRVVPGLEKSDFDLAVLDNYLVARGEKQHEEERTEGRYHVTDCAHGSFERAISLPEGVDSVKVWASYKNGVLPWPGLHGHEERFYR